ncbi:type IX secretion system membrane protein PorP/SprF [Flagellimonas onchidii]|uniref:PorP/SprF family type IX secretion system membrane protein n=1 Tax=Flagellimonas onchidii TaxID=2562684 RepID=UPI0010A5F593|nr:type IX secretion system membrane protein PorP/SprF [Allomuricauda onchidii]
MKDVFMMNSYKNYMFMVLMPCFFMVFEVSGQQEMASSRYMVNAEIINPAYTGISGDLAIKTFGRNQWLGVEGAPRTIWASISSPLNPLRRGNLASFGLSFGAESIGPSNKMQISGDYSYTISFRSDLKVRLGLKAGVDILNTDFTKLRVRDIENDLFTQNIENDLSPFFGVGGMVHTDDWYLGLSTPNILKINLYSGNETVLLRNKSHHYLMGGYVLQIDRDGIYEVMPAFLLGAVSGAPIRTNLSVSLRYRNRLVLGYSCNIDGLMSGRVSFALTDKMELGYAYDWLYGDNSFRAYSSGSHEFFMRFEFGLINSKFF